MQNILLVEDSEESQVLATRSLAALPCRVFLASNASQAVTFLADDIAFDLILLDVELPDRNGFDLCLELQADRRTKHIPVIFITGKGDVKDKLVGFSLGADDYIVKPFDPLEFRARVEAKLNKLRNKAEEEKVLCVGPLRLNLANHTACVSVVDVERDLNLSPREFKLLYHLARRPTQVFTREQLLAAAWGKDVYVNDRTVDTHICTLRRKLDDLAGLVESVSGVGYRFVLARANSKIAA